jgi:hypothetical protein
MEEVPAGLFGELFEELDHKSDDCPMPASRFPKETPVAMAYVPYQFWEKPYDEDLGLSRGTIFPSLDKPFIGEEAVSRGK